MPQWKNYLKGLYDTKPEKLQILVTGSARLETFRKTGDSLAGRFFVHHLLPLSLKEIEGSDYTNDLERIIERGGFPEPFLATNVTDAKRWRENYLDSLLREDIIEFSDINKHAELRTVFEILRTKVGSPISQKNIADDVGISPVTVKRYIEIFEALYIIFTIPTYTKKVTRSILKEKKVYFFDTGLVKGDDGAVFENLVALALKKDILFKRDTEAFLGELKFLKNKEKKEVDFVLTDDGGNIKQLVEVKVSDKQLSKTLRYFGENLQVPGVQVVKNLPLGRREGELFEVREARDFLKRLAL